MLEARIQVILKTQSHNMLKVGVVNMSINPKQSFEYDFNYR